MRAVNKKTSLSAILLSVFLLSAMTVPVLSDTEWTVGVQVGDWFIWEGFQDYYNATEGVPFPPDPALTWLVPWNGTDWIKRTVLNVSGTTITWEEVNHWKNGTETTATYPDDITSLYTHHVTIGANMTVGDQAAAPIPGYSTAAVIDETIDMEYGNVTRETNHARANLTAVGANGYYDWWWDKETGMQVKVIDNTSAVFPQGNASWVTGATLVGSNVIPEFHPWTFMLLIVSASTVALVLFKRRKFSIKT